MPICFFCDSSKNSLPISEPFSDEFVPLDVVRFQCETVFGIQSSKLPFPSDAQTLFSVTGFSNVYGITNAPSKGEGVIKVNHLETLNSFLTAQTILEKKALFLSHGKNFVREYLVGQRVNEITLRALEPIMRYCEQQFELACHAPLYNKRPRGENKQDFIATLEKLGANVSQLLLAGMNIKSLINSNKLTSEDLTKVLTPVGKLTRSQTSNAEALGYKELLTLDEVISDTMKMLSAPPVRLGGKDIVMSMV